MKAHARTTLTAFVREDHVDNSVGVAISVLTHITDACAKRLVDLLVSAKSWKLTAQKTVLTIRSG